MQSNQFAAESIEPLAWHHWVSSSEVQLEEPPLGEGSFGTVYKGRLRGSTVAVKFLVHQTMDDENLVFFRREIQILGGLRSPNIVLFLGACCEPGHFMIITELLPMGDLDNLLRNKRVHLSLFQRMKMARDVVSGMCWLHQNDPQILHRDLKPSNMLVEQDSLIVKLCDFGLAMVKSSNSSLSSSSGPGTPQQIRNKTIGTPSWMAPEVMSRQPHTTKSDVYSFGITLWQLLTRAEPFAGLYEHTEIFDAVCKKKQRPKIPIGTMPQISTLIARCWSIDPNRRPEFKDMVSALDEIIVESAIQNSEGSKLWKKNFLTKLEVPWSTFWTSLSEVLPENTVEEESVDCLYQLLGITTNNLGHSEPVIRIEQFGKVLSWFPGPLSQLLPMIKKICSQPWFFGDYDAERATDLLLGRREGTFLVRFSSKQPGMYTISRADQNQMVVHTRIQHEKDGWTIDGLSSPSVVQLIEKMNVVCLYSCPGSPYVKTFNKKKAEAYDFSDGEEVEPQPEQQYI